MSESPYEDSLDEAEIEYEMLLLECKGMLVEYEELIKKETQQGDEQNMESFEQTLEIFVKDKKALEDSINDTRLEITKKQNQLEESQLELLVLKENVHKSDQLLREKEELVKLLSKQLKEL